LRGYTRNSSVHGLFQSMCVTMFTANSDQVPIRDLAAILRRTGGFKAFGFLPRGGAGLLAGLVDAVVAAGGAVRTACAVAEILTDEHGVTGVRTQDGEVIPADAVISNAGPRATADLLVGSAWDAEMRQRVAALEPATLFGLYFATRFRFMKHPGMLSLTSFSRVSAVGCLSDCCPDWAPEGWHLYFANSVPLTGEAESCDLDREYELMVSDLRTVHPDVLTDERSRVLRFTVHAGEDSAPHRCLPGTEVDVGTPVPGLYEVGDGAKPIGWVGTSGSAESARLAVEQLIAGPTAERI
jgi:phytoene dehydrogenase-like protein